MVVYGSVLGNTEQVAQATAAALQTVVVPVGQAAPDQLEGMRTPIRIRAANGRPSTTYPKRK
ncbi:MAG: hypothetical protein IAE79_02650 [Anaerolinea sp.]|nr:hypothetical protein [Anaerolinea sp.]